MNDGENRPTLNEQKKQILGADIEKIVIHVKKTSKKYLITREQAKKEKRFVGEEKRSSSYFVKILAADSKTEIELIYHDHRRTGAPAQVVVDDKKGNKRWFDYSESGEVCTYSDTKNEQIGLALSFFDDGTLAVFVECKDGKYFGREMMWDESGKLISSKINDGEKTCKVGE
jgi:antitoxin component YwqK of YwqJK toxin-antitoxin module